MTIGEIDPKLKDEIDNIQFYLDYIIEFNDERSIVLYKYWLAEKQRLINRI